MKSIKAFYLVKVALFSAIAFIVAIIEIPVIFLPGFYKLDLSESITLIAGFSLGPMGGFLTEFIKIVLLFILKGSLTMGIGEIANFIVGIALVIPAACIYKNNRTFKGAVWGMALGCICSITASTLLNYYVLFPLYMRVFSVSELEFINIAKSVNTNINNLASLVLLATIPFNVLKVVISCLLSILLYKRLSGIINKVYGNME